MFVTIIGLVLAGIALFLQSYALVDVAHQMTGKRIPKSFYVFAFLSLFSWDLIGLGISYFLDDGVWLLSISATLFYISPAILYCALRCYYPLKRYVSLFLSLILYLTVKTFTDFYSVLSSSFIGDDLVDQLFPIFIAILGVLTLIFCKNINKIWKFEFDFFVHHQDEFERLIKRSIVVMLGIHTVFVVSYILGETDRYDNFGSILATLCFMTFFVWMFYLRAKKEDYEKKEELERQRRDQDNLQAYTDKIVSLYNEVRSFRHDFAGMVSSLRISIDSGNLEEIQQIHREVLETANSRLGAEEFTIFELNNVGDSAFRSVLMDKAIKAEKYGIHLTLDIKEYIGQLPVKRLDFVRITSILFDNAVEAAYASYEKEVVFSMIELPHQYVIVAKNSRKREHLQLDEIYQVGYSTKGKRRGLGLPKVKQLVDDSDNMMLDTIIDEDFFTQVLKIDKERMF